MPAGGVDVFACTAEVRDVICSLESVHTSLVAQLFWVGFRRELVAYDRLPSDTPSGWTFRRKLRYLSDSVFAFTDLPDWLKQVASVFPLKWIAQGMRSVFFPDDWQTQEMAGVWEHGRTALVLGAWLVAGLLVCARTFRWTKRGTT